jgi:RNase P subunit RPR2
MAHNIRFVPDRADSKIRKLICLKCAGGKFTVSHTHMARQVKSTKAHHMRLVATCIDCGGSRRIGFKG